MSLGEMVQDVDHHNSPQHPCPQGQSLPIQHRINVRQIKNLRGYQVRNKLSQKNRVCTQLQKRSRTRRQGCGNGPITLPEDEPSKLFSLDNPSPEQGGLGGLKVESQGERMCQPLSKPSPRHASHKLNAPGRKHYHL